MLPDSDNVHVFIDIGPLFGADWPREDVLSLLKEVEHLELSGPRATNMDHGILAWGVTTPNYFIETKLKEAK